MRVYPLHVKTFIAVPSKLESATRAFTRRLLELNCFKNIKNSFEQQKQTNKSFHSNHIPNCTFYLLFVFLSALKKRYFSIGPLLPAPKLIHPHEKCFESKAISILIQTDKKHQASRRSAVSPKPSIESATPGAQNTQTTLRIALYKRNRRRLENPAEFFSEPGVAGGCLRCPATRPFAQIQTEFVV